MAAFIGYDGDLSADEMDIDGDPVSAIHQQNGANPGRRIFVQLTGDPAPTGMVKGDLLIRQV